MSVTQFETGDVAVLTNTFTDSSSAVVDPTTVSVTVTDPLGTTTTYVYLTDNVLTRLSAGNYQCQVIVSTVGTWLYRWVSTGTGQGAEEGFFWVVQKTLPRIEMHTLIQRVRSLTNAVAGTAQVFTDIDIQDKLDEFICPVNRMPVYFNADNAATTTTFTVGQVRVPGWYAPGTAGVAGTMYDSMGSVITGWSMTLNGWVTFSSNQAGSLRYFSCNVYDVYAASARCLEDWASKQALSFDFITDQQMFNRSQKNKMLLIMADRYWALSIPRVVTMNRDDVWPLGRQAGSPPPRNGGRFTSPFANY